MYLSDVQMDMVQLPISHSQYLNSGRPLDMIDVSGWGHLHRVQVNRSQEKEKGECIELDLVTLSHRKQKISVIY